MDGNPFVLAKVQFMSGAATALDHNPQMKPWRAPEPNNVAGKGHIEVPGQAGNIVWQNRLAPPTDYENALGDALEQVFEAGATTIEQVVETLNGNGFRTADGGPWTVDRFEREMARLGS
jgi:hypothetical protein